MRSRKLVSFAAIGTILSIASVALAAAGWTAGATPTQVWAGFSDGSIKVSGLENKAGCLYSPILFRTTNSDPAKIERLATAAFLSGKKLTCYVDAVCDSSYQSGRDCKLTN